MIWPDLEAAGIDEQQFGRQAEEMGLKTMQGRLKGRLVVHYQICSTAVNILFDLFEAVQGRKATSFHPESCLCIFNNHHSGTVVCCIKAISHMGYYLLVELLCS